ncbi:heat-inducible transcriptional repressor HrcA [Levilactobacillus bambusae]|uniref:Heat-inducible transcription repressor HrcA n=2 Tax=Levilactobacillus bambusae TaxID=2024736 RepID=A0A2V1N0G7_9LACO|nr:heat-inducible transcriptional repressor HrcA [Levilactobacillus bambusae]
MMILRAIVRDYTNSGVPVGSKALAQQLPIHVSSATIRNEMATLESSGLIKKTHSSSGRVPSIKGYRFYVDHLIQPDPVRQNDINLIQSSLGSDFHKIDDIISQSANILSNLTSYTAFTLPPELQESRLSGFRLVPLGKRQVMAILVTDDGNVQNRAFDVPEGITADQLEPVVRLINDQLVGHTLPDVLARLNTDIPVEVSHYVTSPEGFLAIFGDVLRKAAQERFYIGGRLNVLNYSDDQDVDSLKSLYQLLDTNDDLADIIGKPSNQMQVRIGNEITNDVLKNYSLITATYDVDQHGQGMIAILGPTRMQYSRVIGLVDAFREELAKKLLDYYQHYGE